RHPLPRRLLLPCVPFLLPRLYEQCHHHRHLQPLTSRSHPSPYFRLTSVSSSTAINLTPWFHAHVSWYAQELEAKMEKQNQDIRMELVEVMDMRRRFEHAACQTLHFLNEGLLLSCSDDDSLLHIRVCFRDIVNLIDNYENHVLPF